MFASVLSAAIFGMEVREIQVEADVSDGLPSFTMVGFPSAQVREAQERVRTAFKNNRLSLPPKRVTVNFAPADMKKEGAGFDLPVAAAVLAAAGILKPELLSRVLVVGEISLNGEIHGVSGILPRVIRARELGLRFCIIPEENYPGRKTGTGYAGVWGKNAGRYDPLSERAGSISIHRRERDGYTRRSNGKQD